MICLQLGYFIFSTSLTLAQVYDALSYYHDHQDEVEQEVIENTEEYGRAYLRKHLGEEGYLRVTGQSDDGLKN